MTYETPIMERLMINTSARRVRLTREELLAGKCFPEEKPANLPEPDSRFKSPDLVLDRNPNSIVKNPTIDPTVKIAHLENELADLRQRYNREMDEWKEYDRQVNAWKTQILETVNKLKAELTKLKSKCTL